jgi:hypothetical protein
MTDFQKLVLNLADRNVDCIFLQAMIRDYLLERVEETHPLVRRLEAIKLVRLVSIFDVTRQQYSLGYVVRPDTTLHLGRKAALVEYRQKLEHALTLPCKCRNGLVPLPWNKPTSIKEVFADLWKGRLMKTCPKCDGRGWNPMSEPIDSSRRRYG